MVTATPARGGMFLHWLGEATGTNPVATVGMSRNRCVQAVFGTSLSHTVVGSGSVARSPAAGNYFALWGNAAGGTNNPLAFTVTNANATVTNVFGTMQWNDTTGGAGRGGFIGPDQGRDISWQSR